MSDSAFRITLLLTGVAAWIAFNILFARIGGEIADKKGYPRPFGFLLGFYFSLPGYFFLRAMRPNTVELQRRVNESQRRDGTPTEAKREATGEWNLIYPGARPNFRALLALLAVGLGLTVVLQMRPEDLGGRAANIKGLPLLKSSWLCLHEETFTENKNTLIRDLLLRNGRPMLDAAGVPLYNSREVEGIQSEQMKSIGADDYVLRYYRDLKTGHTVQLYLVYRRYGRREFNHNPDMCYPAGGYVLETRDIAELPYAGRMASAVHMTFDGSKVERAPGEVGVPETTVAYLFASGAKTEHSFLKQQLWMALERLLPNKNGWALLRLTTEHRRALPGGKEEAISANEALSAQQDFMQVFADPIEKAITTDTNTNAPVVSSGDTLATAH